MLTKLSAIFYLLTLVTPSAAEGSEPEQYSAQFQGSGIDAIGAANDSAQAETPSNEPDSFVANLTDSEHLTAWAKARAKDNKWGYRLYRTFYPEDGDDGEWDVVVNTFQDIVLGSLKSDAEYGGVDRDPHNVRGRLHFDVVNDASSGLSGASYGAVRERFQQYVSQEYQGPKLGGFKWGGYYKLNVGDDINGMALNQALVIDEGSFDSLLGYNPEKTVYDAEAGETPPYVVAVDACYDPETFTPMTSWTEGYEGWYKVPVELLMLDFYEVTYEGRPMEHFAPQPDDILNIFGMSWGNAEAGAEGMDAVEPEDIQ